MKLNDNERKVLAALGEVYCEDFGFVGFAYLMQATKLDRNMVRRACRSLKRKGLAKFASGLWTDEGTPAGSGYSATSHSVGLVATFDCVLKESN